MDKKIDKIKVEIVTPKKKVYSGEVIYLSAPGEKGLFSIMPGHISFLTDLTIGIIELTLPNETKDYFAISGGYLQVSDNQIWVLAETAENAKDIDEARAIAAKERAEERLAHRSEEVDLKRAEMALRRALNRLKVISMK